MNLRTNMVGAELSHSQDTQLPTVFIDVEIDPKTVGEPCPCLLCGSKMSHTLLDYKFKDNQQVVKNSVPVPGYRCDTCEAEYYEGSTSLRLFEATLPLLNPTSNLLEPLRQRIASLSEAVGKSTPGQNNPKPQ